MKVGIIGAGLQGFRFATPIFESIDSELVCIVDKQFEKAKKLAKKFNCEAFEDWQDAFKSDLDAIVLCTPPDSHSEISIAAMKNGINVLCEKPISNSIEEAKAMMEAEKNNGVVLQIGFNHRFHPAIKQVKKWFDEGEIGEITVIRSVYGMGIRPNFKDEWRGDPKWVPGGVLFEHGIHMIDLMRWFVGDPSEVICYTSNPSSMIEPLEDNAFVTFKTEKNQLINLHASLHQWKNLFLFEVFGTSGYALINGIGKSYGVQTAILGKRHPTAPFSEKIIYYRSGEDPSWKSQWEDFENSVKMKRASITGKDGYESLKLVYAAYNSHKEGRSIAIQKN